jgi:hypothetical protein
MNLRHEQPVTTPGLVGDHADKLSRVRPFPRAVDPERPSGKDRETYHSPFESFLEPVPFPRWLAPWRRRKG